MTDAQRGQLGWIRLWRQIMDSNVWQNAELCKVFCWCLLRANHSPRWVSVKTGRGETTVRVESGQFIFGRTTAVRQLGMKPSSVYNRMRKLEKLGNVNTLSLGYGTLVTVCNWSRYQGSKTGVFEDGEQPSDNQGTTKEQALNTNKKVKKDKNVKKKPPVKKEPRMPKIPDYLKAIWPYWVKSRKANKKQLTPIAVSRQLKKLATFDEPTAIRIVEYSIMNDYQGLIFDRFEKQAEKKKESAAEKLARARANERRPGV